MIHSMAFKGLAFLETVSNCKIGYKNVLDQSDARFYTMKCNISIWFSWVVVDFLRTLSQF